MDLELYIEEDGSIQAVYDDVLVEMFGGEQLTTARASHVEPHPCGPGWLADMRPAGGPVLGANGEVDMDTNPDTYDALVGFKTRAAALKAERAWLSKEMARGRIRT